MNGKGLAIDDAEKTLILSSDFSYRNVPRFGASTINRFSRNASGMKQLAARDFEDLLQVRHYGP